MDAASRYRRRAFAEVGLSAWDSERLQGEHGCLSPSDAVAEELLDVDERARLMRAIAAAYATMYLSAPDLFLWMGFAAIAVHDGVRPTSELAAAAARIGWLRFLDRGVSGRALERLLGATPATAAREGMKAAFEANFAIFADLYWVHLAYRDGGLPRLRELHESGALAADLLQGFELLDAGRGRAREGYPLVVAGNRILFRHEQERSVTPVFRKYGRGIAFASRMGMIKVPNGKLREACVALGRSPEWLGGRHAGTSYAAFTARWAWLVEHTWEPFVELHRNTRAGLHAEIWRVVAEDPEREAPVALAERVARGMWQGVAAARYA
jgi:uncharacterized protein DUF2515